MGLGTLTANQVGRDLSDYTRSMNGTRELPKLPPSMQAVSDEKCLWIYNVGPWQAERMLGTAGRYFIPACPPDKDYVRMVRPVPGIVVDWHIEDEKKMAMFLEPGEGPWLANEIIGHGNMHNPPANSLIAKGVFIGRQRGPDAVAEPDEVAAAKERLKSYQFELVQEARRAYAIGPAKVLEVITDEHHMAGRSLSLDPQVERWMTGQQMPARSRCEGCNKVIEGSPMRCECGYVIDMERYNKAVAEGRFGPVPQTSNPAPKGQQQLK